MSDIVTLISASKKDHLAELFLGLHTQSFRGFEVVLSDDSPNGEIAALIRSGVFDRLLVNFQMTVVQGPHLGSQKNIQHLLDGFASRAPLVHIHLDDDVIYPGFYRAHVQAHMIMRPGASVSQRWLTNADAHPTAQIPLPESVESSPLRTVPVSCSDLFASTVPQCQNWLGGLSNIVFSHEGARRYRAGSIEGLSYVGLDVLGALLDVSRLTPIAIIRDHLSGVRDHPRQSSDRQTAASARCADLAWLALALAAWRDNRIDTAQAQYALVMTVQACEYKYAGDVEISKVLSLVHRYASNLELLYARFAPAWEAFLQGGLSTPGQVRAIADMDARFAMAA